MPKTYQLFCVRVPDSGCAVVNNWRAHTRGLQEGARCVLRDVLRAPEPRILVIHRCL